MSFSPCSRYIASIGRNRTCRIFDAATGAVLRTLEGHSADGYIVALSHTGVIMAGSEQHEDRSVRIWSLFE